MGNIIYDHNISAMQPLAEGGEGIIYEVKGKIYKIYKPVVDLRSKQKKIHTLMQINLPQEVVRPLDEVVDKRGNFVGYVMDKVDGDEVKNLANNKFVKANRITQKDILQIEIKIQKVIQELHKNNIFIGDLNDQNILFDRQFNVYFIDCDSWSVGNEKCEVAMDLYKDPLLKSNEFNADTDTYSFAVLCWKLLTKIHPFGGTMNPDVNILDRMRSGISVIENPDVKIPRTIKSWRNLSPDLINAFKKIFETNCRTFGNELNEMLSELKYCDKDKVYYYGKYTSCPICDNTAIIRKKPISQGVINGLSIVKILNESEINTVFDEKTYLNSKGFVVDINTGKEIVYEYGKRFYFISGGYFVEDTASEIVIHSEKDYVIEKKHKSRIIVNKDRIYLILKQNIFAEITVLKYGNSIRNIERCSNNVLFEVSNDSYFIVNINYNRLIVNIDGRNTELLYDSDIVNYGIHYDEISKSWLLILENSAGLFNTYVIKNGVVDFGTDQIKYTCQLGGVCINNSVLYIPLDGKMRGYAYKKDKFKDFECYVINENSKLLRKHNKFVIINDENIYSLGK